MLNTQSLKSSALFGVVAALTASVVIVLASLTHAMLNVTAYA